LRGITQTGIGTALIGYGQDDIRVLRRRRQNRQNNSLIPAQNLRGAENGIILFLAGRDSWTADFYLVRIGTDSYFIPVEIISLGYTKVYFELLRMGLMNLKKKDLVGRKGLC
jgi:hypothetical protein